MEVATIERTRQAEKEASRVARHRKKVTTSGAKRVEVTVPERDAPLVRAIAGVLRSGGEDAESIRQSLQPLIAVSDARAGKELVAFLRASPFVGSELQIERDQSTGRFVGFG